MSGNRKAAEALILKYIGKAFNGNHNTDMYKSLFKTISDTKFDEWMLDLKSGKRTLSAIVPNMSKVKITAEDMSKLCIELGTDPFQRLWLTDQTTGMEYLTPLKYMVLKLPIRRQSQHLEKGISTPKSNKVVDELTGQPTGESKGSRLSGPEIMTLYATGLVKVIEEFLSVRGGDTDGFRKFEKQLLETGAASMASAKANSVGEVRSKETLAALLAGMHYSNNLNE